MRLAYICADRGVPVAGRTGSSVHITEMVRAMCRRGIDVTLFAATPTDGQEALELPCPVVDLSADPILNDLRKRIAKEIRLSGRESTRASELYNLLLNQTLLHELSQSDERFDVVYERHSLWSVAGLQFARRERVPFLLEVNAPLSTQQQEYRSLDLQEVTDAIEALLFRSADRLLLTSRALSEYVHQRGGSRRRQRVVPCGVSEEMFSDRSDYVHAADSGEFVIGFLGSLKPWHGLEPLLKAFLKLRARHDGYRLLIVGDGPLREYVELMSREHGLSECVTLAGGVKYADVATYLAQMDVGVAPYPDTSSFYFSPLKIWEYAAAGVPIVASAVGNLPTTIPHKKAALLHHPGSSRKLADHIEKLRTDRDLGRRIARNARRIARRNTWDRQAARIETAVTHIKT